MRQRFPRIMCVGHIRHLGMAPSHGTGAHSSALGLAAAKQDYSQHFQSRGYDEEVWVGAGFGRRGRNGRDDGGPGASDAVAASGRSGRRSQFNTKIAIHLRRKELLLLSRWLARPWILLVRIRESTGSRLGRTG